MLDTSVDARHTFAPRSARSRERPLGPRDRLPAADGPDAYLMTPLMKHILPILVLPIVTLTAACTTQGTSGNDHWSQRSISNSMGRAFIGYDQSRDGDYLDFQAANKQSAGLIARRYFFHQNPENPFEAYDPTYYRPRYPNSILPDTVSYLQDPVSSVFGTFSEGGADEFSAGLSMVGDGVSGRESQRKSASYLRSSVVTDTE